jgi:DNA-binding response OmpR family regulator
MPSVLVIDDEPAIRDSIRQVLTRRGFEVATAGDGIAGVERYLQNPPDVLIVDIMMPRSDGIAVIKKVRAAHPGARIIAITGGGNFGPLGYRPAAAVTEGCLLLASQSGADAVMTKPFHRRDLIATVHGLLVE